MKALKIISVFAVVVALGFMAYQWRVTSASRQNAQTQLLNAMRAQQAFVKQSPAIQAWKNGDLAALTGFLKEDLAPTALNENLQSLIRAVDTDEATAFDAEGRKKLFDHTLALTEKLQPRPRRERARAQALATQLLRRLAADITGPDALARATAITTKCKRFSREDDLCAGLIETAAAFPQTDPSLLEVLERDLSAKDAAAVQQAIMTGESIRDPALRDRFRGELLKRYERLQEAVKPLALRSLVDLHRESPTVVQDKVRKIAGSSDDRWTDVFLYSVSTLELTDQYRQEIERISREASSPTIRMKASTLLEQKGDKR